MNNLKTITITFHINEQTGKIVNATQYDGSPGEFREPQGKITDSQSIVVSQNSPYCISYQINNVWYTFCY